MDWGVFIRREWGAVLFVVTVAAGLLVVPLALYLNGQRPAAEVAVATPTPATASGPRMASTPATGPAVTKPTPTPTR